MTPVFRAGMIVQALNRYLGVFGHRIQHLQTREGKILGSRGARRWRSGTGARYGTCKHCQEVFEIFGWGGPKSKGGSRSERYMVTLYNKQTTWRSGHPNGHHIFFYLIEDDNGFLLEKSLVDLHKNRRENVHLVCKRIRILL